MITKEKLEAYCIKLLVSRGINRGDAKITADAILYADLRGIDSHGVMRFVTYLQRLDQGLISRENNITTVTESDTFAVIDGGNYIGPVAAKVAMDKAIEKAKKNVVGIALVRNNHHYGACSYYSSMALKHDMIGFTASNTAPLMAPTGGKKRLIGNNPFSFAAPAGKYNPFILDMACSVVAAGKILLAEKNGKTIPIGWALDKEGKPTESPYEGFEGGGMLLPIGEHKGYGMAVMLDILSGVLTGSAFGTEVKAIKDFSSKGSLGTGHFMAALNIEPILGVQFFKNRMDQLIEEIKSCPTAEDVDEIMIPGEISQRVYEERIKQGIPINRSIVNDLNELGKIVGIDDLLYIAEK